MDKEIKEILSNQEKLIEHKVASSVLSQTSIFFIALVVLIAVLSGWFSFIVQRVNQAFERVNQAFEKTRRDISDLKSDLKRKS